MTRNDAMSVHEQMLLKAVDSQRVPFLKGISNGSWFRESVFTRIATTGFRYPAHVDCESNMLYSMSGHRRLILVDAKALFRRFPSRVPDILALRDLETDTVAQFGCTAPVRIADLYPGDVLMIPTLWLHEVTYVSGGVGINTFYASRQLQQKGDPMLCRILKNPRLRKNLMVRGDLVNAIQFSERPLNEQY